MGLHTRAKMEGEVLYRDENLLEASPRALNRIRGQNLSMIFQDPLTALNPLMTIGHQIEEVLLLHRDDLSGRQRKERAIELLGQVGISRSEEHTSELQSRGHLVCRLLLETKKQ